MYFSVQRWQNSTTHSGKNLHSWTCWNEGNGVMQSLYCYSARSYNFAEYWIHFIARLNGIHSFGYNSAGSLPIWMKFGAPWVHCLLLVLANFGCDPRRSERNRAREKFLWGKQCTISPTSRRTNFTKFAHKKCRDESFRNKILKIYPYWVTFFKKGKFWAEIFNNLRLQAPITP